ncbi:MAG: lytic transglycosylase F [Nitrospirae bacterium]|nr:MAG: lytic transglycosylase F [Nitrospirota bacterium]
MIASLSLAGCDTRSDPTHSSKPVEDSSTFATDAPRYVETGDLSRLKARGYLRVLRPPHASFEHLPRQGFPDNTEDNLLETLAESHGLRLALVTVARHEDLIPALLEGRGDLIAANFTVTPQRKQRIAFSVPVAVVREQLITRQSDDTLSAPEDLQGRTIVIRRSSSFWETAMALRQRYPGIQVIHAPEHLDTEQILDRVARHEYDLTIADSNLFRAVLTYRSDLKVAFDLTEDRPVAWGIRPDNPDLLEAVNTFLTEAKLTAFRPRISHDDLPGIAKHGVLRVLTRNNPATYFLWRGELLGFEYELARHFAKSHHLQVEMIVPPSRDDLIPWLLEGKGDVIAASMTITPERMAQGVAFSRPYFQASEIVVTRASEPEARLQGPKDLAGRTVVVRRSSSYWQTLTALRNQGIAVTIEAAPEDLETEEIIAKVASGEYDLTVADSHLLDIELTWREDIRAAFPLGDPKPHGWVVRATNPKLLQAINAYFDKEYRGTFYNLTVKKYFKNPRTIRTHVKFRAKRTGQLSPYDDLVQKYARLYGFDWRLIVAQMYQESRFNPKARSWAGAVGLLQVLPRTAKGLGFPTIESIEDGIHAGVKYLNWVRDRFEPELPIKDRMWLALAAYNVGHGHVMDARRLARQLGLNPNRWFGHVERAMRLLSKRKYARHARHGYCRGSEPVKYVRQIKERYEAYVRLTEL